MKKLKFKKFLVLCILFTAFIFPLTLNAQSSFPIAQSIHAGNTTYDDFVNVATNSQQLRAEFLEGLHGVNRDTVLQAWFLIYPSERDDEDLTVIQEVLNSMPLNARIGDVYLVQVDRYVSRGVSADGWIIYLQYAGDNVWDNVMYYFHFTL